MFSFSYSMYFLISHPRNWIGLLYQPLFPAYSLFKIQTADYARFLSINKLPHAMEWCTYDLCCDYYLVICFMSFSALHSCLLTLKAFSYFNCRQIHQLAVLLMSQGTYCDNSYLANNDKLNHASPFLVQDIPFGTKTCM